VGGNDSSDEEQDEVGITSNQWGKNKKTFFGTSFVDKDFGGVHDSDEAEVLELEEEDARNRQRRMESANALVDLTDFDVELDSDDGEAETNIFLTVDEALVLEIPLLFH
jgi:U3 small nucleolar RNA-associated protein 3